MKIVTKQQAEKIKENSKVVLLSMEMTDDYIADFQCTRNPEHFFSTKIYNVMQGTGCTYCKYALHFLSKEEFEEQLKRVRPEMILIGEYKGLREKTTFQCLNGENHIFEATPHSIKSMSEKERKQCPFCLAENRRKKNENVQIELAAKAKENGYTLVGEYTKHDVPIDCVCDLDNTHKFKIQSRGIRNGQKCPVCYETKRKYNPNGSPTIREARPDMVSLFLDESEADIYTPSSGMRTWFVCPNCKQKKYALISSVSVRGLYCDSCSCSNSYPNRFMYSILKSAGINFTTEYSPKWACGKRYDFYFENNNKKYAIEMDGIFHFVGVYNSAEKVIETDMLKDSMALDHDITVIRIDCNYGKIQKRYDYIKTNILKSELSRIINLENIDFDKCDAVAATPMMKEIADLWNRGIKTLRGIQKEVDSNYSVDKISRIVRNAAKAGMLSESLEDVQQMIKSEGYTIAGKKQKELSKKNGPKIICVETGKVYDYPYLAYSEYGNGVYKCLKGQQKHAGCLPDGTKLSWKYL